MTMTNSKSRSKPSPEVIVDFSPTVCSVCSEDGYLIRCEECGEKVHRGRPCSVEDICVNCLGEFY